VITVDSTQQRCLVHDDSAGVTEEIEGFDCLRGDLARMVEMGHDVDPLLGTAVSAYHIGKIRIV